MTRSVGKLDDSIKSRVAGVVLYGDTQNKQTGGSIPDYPKDDVLVICAKTDGVCGGALLVTPGHLTYVDDVPDAVQFLAGKAKDLGSSGVSASTSTGADESSSASSGSALSGLGGLGGRLGGDASGSGLFGLSGLGGSSATADEAATDGSSSASTSGLGGLFLFGGAKE